jgi:F-type H+-transporting ATPase subunit a
LTRRLIIAGVVLYTAFTAVISLFFFRPPKPIIDIKAEKLTSVGPLDITNTLFTAWVVMALLIAFWFFASRRAQLVPRGIQNLAEAVIELLYNFVTSVAGEKNGRRFFPLVATLLIYIAFANLFSLTPLFNAIGIFEPLGAEEKEFHERAVIFKESGGLAIVMPGAKSIDIEAHESECDSLSGSEKRHCLEEVRQKAIDAATSGKVKEGEKAGILAPYLRGINTDIMTPASFAIMSAIFVEYWAITSLGFFAYGSKFINLRGPVDFFVGLLELVAEIARLISFTFRLFGNMLAGEILLLVMTFMMPFVSVVLLIFYGLEMFVGLIQGFVFAALTLVFAVMAVSHGGGEHAEEGLREH